MEMEILSFFPTKTAKMLATKADIMSRLPIPLDLGEALRDFQKISAMGDYESAMTVFGAWLETELDEEQIAVMKRIHDLTEMEVTGIIFDKVGAMMDENLVAANTKLDAAKLCYDLKTGDVEAAKGVAKKIIFELQE